MNPVTVGDVEDRYQPLDQAKRDLTIALLSDAWAETTARVPTAEARLAAGTLSPDLVKRVVCAAVIRVLRNPEGLRSWSVDDAQFTRDTGGQGGALYLAPGELALLDGTAGARGGFTGSFRMDV